MPSRTLLSNHASFPNPEVLYLVISISAFLILFFSTLYFLFRFFLSRFRRAKTIPFDSNPPLINRLRYSYNDLKKATNNFDSANVIGKGGSGSVFRGTLKDAKLIAVKRLDFVSLQSETEFQNELQILSGLKSKFLVTLLGYCSEKNERLLVYEYMPNRSLQESLFSDGCCNLSWHTRFEIILDVAKGLEFLHRGCDPPVIHGDIKPSNVLLDFNFRAKISDFGLSRVNVPDDFGVDLLSQELSPVCTPLKKSSIEVDFSLSLKASSSKKSSGNCYKYKSKDFSNEDELSSTEHSKELKPTTSFSFHDFSIDERQWGKKLWWKQDESSELCSKDYVDEWIGSQIFLSMSPDWDEEKTNTPKDSKYNHSPENSEHSRNLRSNNKSKKMQEWWQEEHLHEIITKGSKKFNRGFKIPHFDLSKRFYILPKKTRREQDCYESNLNRWKKKGPCSVGSNVFSRELGSTTSMRGTLCYAAPENAGPGFLMEKSDIYSFGVLVLVIVSGRRPLHVLASPMELEKANLISWCRQLVQSGNLLELVDERLKGEYDMEEVRLCIKLALICLRKSPHLRPGISDIVKIINGDMDLSPFYCSNRKPKRKEKVDSIESGL